jgi:hypothetical protein
MRSIFSEGESIERTSIFREPDSHSAVLGDPRDVSQLSVLSLGGVLVAGDRRATASMAIASSTTTETLSRGLVSENYSAHVPDRLGDIRPLNRLKECRYAERDRESNQLSHRWAYVYFRHREGRR